MTPDLVTVVAEIRSEYNAAVLATGAALDHLRRCGDRLAKVRATVPEDAWPAWLVLHFPEFQPNVTAACMLLATSQPSVASTSASRSLLPAWPRIIGRGIARAIRRLPPDIRAHLCNSLAEPRRTA